MWYLSRRIDTLREFCCDELACGRASLSRADSTAVRLRYAMALVRIVEIAQPALAGQHHLAALAASGRNPSQLRRRVARLLGEPACEPLRLSRGALLVAAVALLAVCVGPLMATMPPAEEKTAAVDRAAERDDRPANAFSFGAKVEGLTLGTHDQQPQQWWNADGIVIDGAGLVWRDTDNVSSADKKWRRMIFQIDALPNDAEVQWKIIGARASASGEVRFEGKPQPEHLFARYFGVADDQATVDLRVGVASGSWTNVHTLSKRSPEAWGGADGKIIVSSGAVESASGAMLVVSHNFFDRNFRVVAVDKQNNVHDTAGRGGVSAGSIYQTRATFHGLPLDRIDHFEFQTRDYEWIQFVGLPLEPTKGKPSKRQQSQLKRRGADGLANRPNDYSGRDLAGERMVGGIKAFYEAKFIGATLTGATLSGGAAFQKADFTKANLIDATLRSGISGVQMAVFDEADATHSTLVGGASSFQLASFVNTKLRHARLSGQGGAFQRARFDGADLSDAVIECDSVTAFQGASLTSANFSGADLRTIDHRSLESCTFDRCSPPALLVRDPVPGGF